MPADSIILTLHAATTVLMTGLIWFVQVVHYPLLAAVGRDQFVLYEIQHTQRTGRIVGPLMLLEMELAILLVLGIVPSVSLPLAWAGLVLVVALWGSTAFVQVPCHRRLLVGFDEGTWRRLVRSNWWRTAGWSARSVLALYLLLPGPGG